LCLTDVKRRVTAKKNKKPKDVVAPVLVVDQPPIVGKKERESRTSLRALVVADGAANAGDIPEPDLQVVLQPAVQRQRRGEKSDELNGAPDAAIDCDASIRFAPF
jgi:hypothetical protein